MEIIDSHAHIYPAKIAKKATQTIGEFYNIEMQMSEGTAEQLIIDGGRAGISRYVVHSCATTAKQVRPINEYILSEARLHKEFIPFMTLHQDLTEQEIADEVDWCVKNGFKGELFLVGDALEVAGLLNNIKSAFFVGKNI